MTEVLRPQARVLGGAALIAIALAIGAASVLRDSGKTGEAVRTSLSQRRDVTHKVLAQGKVRARTQVEVASEIGGRVAAVHVAVGDIVNKGDALFAIDDEQAKNTVDQLRVALSSSEAVAKRANLALIEAERASERDRKLTDSGVVAEEQLKLSESRANIARADLEQANAGIERTRLDLQRAKDALRRAKVSAPTSGTVVAVGVEIGQVVSAVQGLADGSSFGAGSGPSAPVIIADLAELIVKLDVDELDVGLVKVGQKAVVRAQGLKELAFAGVVERVGLLGRDQAGAVLFVVEVAIGGVQHDSTRALSPKNGDGAVDAPLPAARDLLRSGMSAQADIEVQKIADVVAVPVAAVLEGDGAAKPDRVFVYEGNDTSGRVREAIVKLGPTQDEAIAILAGLDAGVAVVAGPFRALKGLADGDRVTIEVKASNDAKGQAP